MSEKGEGYPWLIGDKLTVQERTRLLLYLVYTHTLLVCGFALMHLFDLGFPVYAGPSIKSL